MKEKKLGFTQKLIKNSIITLFLILIFISCNSKNDSVNNFENDITLLEKIINDDMRIFVKYDSLNYYNDYIYIKAKSICSSADYLINSFKENNLVKDSLLSFLSTLNNVCKTTENSKMQLENYQTPDNSSFAFKIRFFQHIAISYYVKKYQNNYFPMQSIMPIIVPKKKEILLGEEFIADIYLSGIDKNNIFVAITDNNDTLKYGDDPFVPIIRENPKTKGKKEINGYLQVYHPIFGKRNYDFHYEYTVK